MNYFKKHLSYQTISVMPRNKVTDDEKQRKLSTIVEKSLFCTHFSGSMLLRQLQGDRSRD